jgi:hypothetical protein
MATILDFQIIKTMRQLLLLCSLTILCTCVRAQSEIRWTINLNTDQIVQTDKRVFQSLEKDLQQFLNGQQWTNDKFDEDERIEATMFLTISEQFQKSSKGDGASVAIPNEYKGTLAIQSLRPVFGTGQQTPVLNTLDKFVNFTYRQGEGVQYSEQSYISDLGQTLGFYCYLIIGFDYDTFSPLGGQAYFDQAQELYNRLPTEVTNTPGWKSGNKSRNRYWLMENILNPRMLPLRRGYYTYHRLGLDMMTQDVASARSSITLAIQDAQKANQSYPATVFVQAFVDAKRDEVIEIYKGSTGVEQNTVISVMSRIDPSKSAEYRGIRFRGGSNPRSNSRAPVSRGRGLNGRN